MSRQPRPRFVDELMAEPIRMPGCPGLIVTRAQAYQWLKAQGYPTDARAGYASVDYMVFRQPVSDQPLADDETRAATFAAMAQTEA